MGSFRRVLLTALRNAALPGLAAVVCVAAAGAQPVDSSAVLFDDGVVHEFNITFYIDGWQDSLLANYAAGELYMPARVEYKGMVFDSVGVRYKGNSSYVQSRHTPKKPLKFAFDEYRDKQTCCGMKTLNFSNAVKDPTFLREKLAYGILAGFLPSPRAAYATVSVNGAPLGLYLMIEQVDKTFLGRHFSSKGYNLYKASDKGATLEYRGGDKEAYKSEYELKTNEKADDWSRFIAMLQALNNSPADSFAAQAGRLLDLQGAARFLAFSMAVSNFDSYLGSGRNFYLYDDESEGRFKFIPWDPNEAFGAYSNDWDVIGQDALTIANLSRRPLTRRILEHEPLRIEYLRAIRHFIDGPASYDSISAAVARWKPFLDPLVDADPNKLYSYQNFLDNFEHDVVVGINMTAPALLPFSRERCEELRAQLAVYLGEGTPGEGGPIPEFACFPNPGGRGSLLRYRLRRAGNVALEMSDLSGRIVKTVACGLQLPGLHSVTGLDGGLPSGIYFFNLTFSDMATGAAAVSGKLAVIR